MNPDPTSLDRLHELIQPPPIPWWPPAEGWYWVSGFILIGFFVLLFCQFVSWQRNCYRREAMAELARLEPAFANPEQYPTACLAMAVLLKRAALSAWPRAKVASLTGAKWLAFLDRSGRMTGFAQGAGTKLAEVNYDSRLARRMSEKEVRELNALTRQWLKQHQVGNEEIE